MPPHPKTQAITHHVPEHLIEALLQATDEFFSAARGGQTRGQRAVEVRAQDRHAGLDSPVQRSVLELVSYSTHSASTSRSKCLARM